MANELMPNMLTDPWGGRNELALDPSMSGVKGESAFPGAYGEPSYRPQEGLQELGWKAMKEVGKHLWEGFAKPIEGIMAPLYGEKGEPTYENMLAATMSLVPIGGLRVGPEENILARMGKKTEKADIAPRELGKAGGGIMINVGKNSMIPNPIPLERAIDMLSDGKDMSVITEKTGWFKGKDDQWRFRLDIDDIKIKLPGEIDLHLERGRRAGISEEDLKYYRDRSPKGAQEGTKKWNLLHRAIIATPSLTFKDIIDAPNLFKAYPQLANIRIEYPGYGLQYDPKSKILHIPDANQIHLHDRGFYRRSLVHEIQHMIQGEEGFNVDIAYTREARKASLAEIEADEIASLIKLYPSSTGPREGLK